MTDRALLNVRQAAAYLGCSKGYFEQKIRPYVASIDLKAPGSKKPMPRWELAVLDQFIESRRKAQRAKAVA